VSEVAIETVTTTEGLEALAPASRARHAGDPVAGGDQLTDGASPDDSGGSGDDDLVHVSLTR